MDEKYEINADTLAIVGLKNGKSRIIEYDAEKLYDDKAYSIMEYGCNYFGSSYKGRVDGTKNILGYSYKVPVIVEESQDLIFFPTTSPSDEECSWFSINSISLIEEKYDSTIVTLNNNKKIVLPVSKKSLENQILRATRLKYLLNCRKKAKN